MSTPARPSTPVAQSTPTVPHTGTWRHPKLDEIVRRQNASNFTSANTMKILYNAGGAVGAFIIGRFLWQSFPSVFQAGRVMGYGDYIYYALQLIFVTNIAVACLPLFRAKDDISDIPLTPAQRKLLGLPASSAPPTPGSAYITPPRYSRTPTPLSGSPGARGNYSNSPLSGKGSPIGGSPFSPGASSPLLQKALGGGLNGNRRGSYGSPSPLGPTGSRVNLPETPASPSPMTKGGALGLNSKWLYDKGRRNSGNSSLYT